MDQARVKPPTPEQNSTTRHAGCRQLTNSTTISDRRRASHIASGAIRLQKISCVLLEVLWNEGGLGSEHKSGLDQTTQLLKC